MVVVVVPRALLGVKGRETAHERTPFWSGLGTCIVHLQLRQRRWNRKKKVLIVDCAIVVVIDIVGVVIVGLVVDWLVGYLFLLVVAVVGCGGVGC